MKVKTAAVLMSVCLLSGCQSQNNFLENIDFWNGDGASQDDGSNTENNNETAGANNEGQNPEEEKQNQATSQNEFVLPAEYFNEVEVVDGKPTIQNTDNYLMLVNKEFYLPEGYIPEDLVRADVEYSFGDEIVEKALMRKEAATALEEMFRAATEEGIELFAVSGYRSYSRQEEVFNNEVALKGNEAAMEAVALPGQSEHQTGLTMDISSRSVNLDLTQDYEYTDEGRWLAENAHKYGFILRYPKGKEEITGYKFEPWHFRFVGKTYSKIIYEKNLTLEEYFELVKEV